MKRTIPGWLFCLSVFLFSGCFETDFDFKTIVQPDGAVFREMNMNGRGGHLFKVPSGPGWEVKAWETKGKETILADTAYHRIATGRFLPNQAIESDYVFDVETLSKNWDDEDKIHLEAVGIKPPYEENLYSRNRIQIQKVKGWLTETFFYEEVFETKGLIELLTNDLKEDIKRQNEGREDALDEEEINELVRLKLEDEYLAPIHFRSELMLPGRIVSTNAPTLEKGKAVWRFTAKDFQSHYSVYTLRATSRTISLTGMILLILIGGVGILLVLLLMMGLLKAKKKGPTRGRKKHKEPSEREEIN